MATYTLPLNALCMDDVPVVGGKNASLGEMLQNLQGLGVRVPDGFATTAEAYRELDPQWPEISQPKPAQQIIAALPNHPKLRAWQYQVEKNRTVEDIARQAYKPGFAVDLAYGGRGGQNPDGSNRSDFLSVFVTMDIPLFTKNRQDRVLASSIADTTVTEYARDDIYRSMKARVEEHSATLANERERLGLTRMYCYHRPRLTPKLPLKPTRMRSMI